jgi:hypothetical protein
MSATHAVHSTLTAAPVLYVAFELGDMDTHRNAGGTDQRLGFSRTLDESRPSRVWNDRKSREKSALSCQKAALDHQGVARAKWRLNETWFNRGESLRSM